MGRDVCRLRKAYYGARHEAAVQIDEIVGETVSEADSSDSMDRDHAHHSNKDDDIIRCICGMYKDEGLMIQCEKCMVHTARFHSFRARPGPTGDSSKMGPELRNLHVYKER